MTSHIRGLFLLALILLSSVSTALTLPSSVQRLRQSAFCKKYLCKITPDTSIFALGGKALERLDYLSDITLETRLKGGKLTRLTLNMQSSIPGDGAKPNELETVFGQMDTLKHDFSRAFLPRSLALEVSKGCDYGSGRTLSRSFTVQKQKFRLTCEFFSVTLEAL